MLYLRKIRSGYRALTRQTEGLITTASLLICKVSRVTKQIPSLKTYERLQKQSKLMKKNKKQKKNLLMRMKDKLS